MMSQGVRFQRVLAKLVAFVLGVLFVLLVLSVPGGRWSSFRSTVAGSHTSLPGKLLQSVTAVRTIDSAPATFANESELQADDIRRKGGKRTGEKPTRIELDIHTPDGSRARRKMFEYVSVTTKSAQKSDKAAPLKPVRILCWIMTDPNDLEKRTKHVKNTWGRRCDVTLYMSSARNDTFPTIGLPVLAGRNHIAAKSKAAWKHVYENYFDEADFFVKADPDTYVVVENLREYLSHRDPWKPEYYGHRFHQPGWRYSYVSGGSGVVLSKEALRRLVKKAFSLPINCMPDGQGEDWKTADCLTRVGASAVDTRDSRGRERFLVFNPVTHIKGRYPEWYIKRDPDGALKGWSCCSHYPVSFHYIKPEEMYVLEYFLYRARPHGKEIVPL